MGYIRKLPSALYVLEFVIWSLIHGGALLPDVVSVVHIHLVMGLAPIKAQPVFLKRKAHKSGDFWMLYHVCGKN